MRVGEGTNERGFASVHGMGSIGHLQDIAVAKNQQGKNLGFRMLTALDSLAKEVGCYKVRRRFDQLRLRRLKGKGSDHDSRLSLPPRKPMRLFMLKQAFVAED